MSVPTPVLVPYGEDAVTAAAEWMVARCSDQLPRLDRVVVLMPDLGQSARLRSSLMDVAARQGHTALLGPRIETLPTYLAGLAIDAPPTLPADARELVLLEALRRHADLFGDADLWRLARDLLALFDELNLQQRSLPRDLGQFRQQLRGAYGIATQDPAHLSREAEIVHTLWRAWHTQLEAERVVDHNGWYLRALSQSLHCIPPDTRFFAVGFSTLRPAESAWLRTLQQRGQAEVLLHGAADGEGYHPGSPLRRLLARLGAEARDIPAPTARAAVLDAAFEHGERTLAARAEAVRHDYPQSPVSAHLSVFTAADSEQEARAVELQVRRWLLEGHRRIGVVTEDRRLARRVRALLERAGVVLADSGGWALSTTSSATVIERWLQTVEEDFAHQPMLDLLKSPLLWPAEPETASDYQRALYRLEQDIILHENIARGLDRYRKHLRYRQRRLGWSSRSGAAVSGLLDRLEHAARPLLPLLRGDGHGLHTFVDALLYSLQRLDVLAGLNADDAGARILQQLERLQQAAHARPLNTDWLAFRGWLGAALEAAHFRPASPTTQVQLLSLEQTTLAHFDALVLAGAEREYLPGRAPPSPYFNDQVRRELGLPGWHEHLSLRLHHFRRLLEAAPQVLITHRREQDGEELLPSPWLEAIQTLHQHAYADPLNDQALADLLADTHSQVTSPDSAPPPTPAPNPRVTVPAARLPEQLSAASQQRLIDCPYQFFAADCLRLKPVEEVREALEKSDYGERVHLCLQAFHGGVDGLPGPFEAALEASNRDQAQALLQDIARAVFARDLEDNFIHRGWLKRWLAMIPAYIDWQLQRESRWRPAQVERSVQRALTGPWQLKGRLDRIDRDQDGRLAVIDYKTGAVPSADQVESGEAVQLISYALLLDDVAQVEYLQLDRQVRSHTVVTGDALFELRDQVGARLETLLSAMSAGSALPAWGDAQTCQYCAMAGICRRQTWDGPVR